MNARCLILTIICTFMFAIGARAAEKSFVVLPFSVNAPQSYNYLSKAVPSTIQQRLNRPGALAGKTASARGASESDARKALSQARADYAIWGVVNVMGNDASIELHSIDKNGKTWTRSGSGPVSNLTGTVNDLAASLSAEAMGEPVMARPGFMAARGAKTPAQANSDILVNETGQNQVYLNPQFRYQGAGANDGSRMRSQRIKENMVDMAVGDFNGDG
ncbi:MAG: VCBS repeat-containing protein, partial [Desulfovibrio sp.]|nr:VCBS repeat-containing protein [Desulfovibrio sp.]